MALMVPNAFPHDLKKRPKLAGEALVFAALQAALDDEWRIFYDRPIPRSRRRVDFIAANARRGLLAFEVKGGMVHDKRGAFRQLVSTAGQRKRIDPFGQLKLGLRDLYSAAGVSLDAYMLPEADDHQAQCGAPVHQAIWFPEMGQGGLRWQPTPHILTREILDATRLRGMVATCLHDELKPEQSAAVMRLMIVLSHSS